MLLRLEKNELIAATYRHSALGPRRKYYTLTVAGQAALSNFFDRWQELRSGVDTLFSDCGRNTD